MTYNVFGGTLNLALSIYPSELCCSWADQWPIINSNENQHSEKTDLRRGKSIAYPFQSPDPRLKNSTGPSSSKDTSAIKFAWRSYRLFQRHKLNCGKMPIWQRCWRIPYFKKFPDLDPKADDFQNLIICSSFSRHISGKIFTKIWLVVFMWSC